MMAIIVYVLCALTSGTSMVLLLREYRKNGIRLLLWMTICFLGLTLSNLVLVMDKFVVPDTSLATLRVIPAVGGFAVLIFGLIWDTV